MSLNSVIDNVVEQVAAGARLIGGDPPVSAERRVRVWTHVLNDVEEFPNAVAQVQPNGVLLVMSYGSPRVAVPIKGYAPGAWLTFEHVNFHTASTPPPAPVVEPAPDPVTRIIPAVSEPVEIPVRRRSESPDERRRYGSPKDSVGPGTPSAADSPTQLIPAIRHRWRQR